MKQFLKETWSPEVIIADTSHEDMSQEAKKLSITLEKH